MLPDVVLTEYELRDKLRHQLRSKVTIIAYFTERIPEIFIHDLMNKYSYSIAHIDTIQGIAFLSAKQLAVIGKQVLSIYNLTTKLRTNEIAYNIPNFTVLTVVNEYVLFGMSFGIICAWNTVTNTVHSSSTNDVLEIVPIGGDEFMICSGKRYLTQTDTKFQRFVKTKTTPYNFTCDKLNSKELLLHSDNWLYAYNLETLNIRQIIKTELEQAYYMEIVAGTKVLLTDDKNFCSMYDLTDETNFEKDLFISHSSTYAPFRVKGSLVYYYRDKCIHVLDIGSMSVIQVIQTEIKRRCEVNMAIW
jgi:hypothetical protein